MRRLLLLAVLAAPAQAEDWKAVVEKPAGAIVQDKKYATVVVGVLDKDREHVLSFGAWEGKAPDRDSVYEIGSVTKVFTGLLLADRVKAGVVKLDDPVQNHLPNGWTVPRRDDRDIRLIHRRPTRPGCPSRPTGSWRSRSRTRGTRMRSTTPPPSARGWRRRSSSPQSGPGTTTRTSASGCSGTP